jgi:hypothetical protein
MSAMIYPQYQKPQKSVVLCGCCIHCKQNKAVLCLAVLTVPVLVGGRDDRPALPARRSATRSAWQVPLLCARILVVSSKPQQIARREFGVCFMYAY